MQNILFKYPINLSNLYHEMETALREKYSVSGESFNVNERPDINEIDKYDAVIILTDADRDRIHSIYSLISSLEDKACLIVSLNYYGYTEEFYSSGVSWVLQSDRYKKRFIKRLPIIVAKRLHQKEFGEVEKMVGSLILFIIFGLIIYLSFKYGVNNDVGPPKGGCRRCS